MPCHMATLSRFGARQLYISRDWSLNFLLLRPKKLAAAYLNQNNESNLDMKHSEGCITVDSRHSPGLGLTWR